MEPITHMNKLLSGAIRGSPWGRTHSFSARFSAAAFSLIEAMLVELQQAAKNVYSNSADAEQASAGSVEQVPF